MVLEAVSGIRSALKARAGNELRRSRFTPHCSLFTALAFVAIATNASAGAIEKLKAFAGQTQSARASFTQTVRDKTGTTVQSASGKLAFSRPGKFRWDYEKPYQQVIVGDGEKLWIYDKDLDQVTVKIGRAHV